MSESCSDALVFGMTVMDPNVRLHHFSPNGRKSTSKVHAERS